MEINTSLHCKDEEVKVKSCVTEKIIELTDEEYKSLCEDLMLNRDFITENQDLMYTDQNGAAHCILALGKSYDDGILINSEGYGYAKYYSVIPNARQFVILDKYPVLNSFIERMSEVADDILSKAVAESSAENREYEVDIEKYNIPGEPIIESALLFDMLTDSGMVEDSILHDEYIEIMLTEQAANNRYREHYDANSSTELEIICAKHALWIYGEKGGVRADFSNCLLDNVNFSNCNLCGADFSGTVLINCKLDDASMCDADFENAKFKQCSLRHFTAEGADFKESDFYNCDLRGAYFTASNFTKSKMADCNFYEASFMNCCLEDWISTDCNFKIADMRNVSYDETEWLEDNNECMSMGGM